MDEIITTLNLPDGLSRGIMIAFLLCVLVCAAALIDMWTGIDACEESGDMLVPLRTGLIQPEQIRLIHTALDKGSMQETGETVVFKTVGMALVDLLAAEEVCRMAEEKKGSVNVAL